MQTRKPEPKALASLSTRHSERTRLAPQRASVRAGRLGIACESGPRASALRLRNCKVSAIRLAPAAQIGKKPRTKFRRSGLSLLEVVLALSILAVSAALLTQITKQATDNGRMAQRLSTAQMLCESKMSEVLAGAIPLTSSSWAQITDSRRRSAWYYKIQTSTAERPNMIGVRLSVTDQPDATSGNPELFFIVRWMIDPSLGLDTLPTSTSTTGASSSGSGGIQ